MLAVRCKKMSGLSLLQAISRTEEVVRGRIVKVEPTTKVEDLVNGPRANAAKGLAGECPLRLTAADHACGHHIHLRRKDTGRVGCYAANSELLQDEHFLQDWEYTPNQLELLTILNIDSQG